MARRIRWWGRVLGAALLIAGAVLQAETKSPPASSPGWQVAWQPTRFVNGSPVIFRVRPPVRLESLSAKWLEHEVQFASSPKSKVWDALAGVSLNTKPGIYTLVLKGITKAGKEISFSRRFKVGTEKYRTISVTVETKYTEPSKEQLEAIARDKQTKQEAFAHVTPEREWAGSFQAPVTAPISDTFGTRRVFNGEVRSVHQGLDFAAPAGTAITALNAGTVLLARPLYFEGNFVVLDHGQGLLSLYLHMSEIKVKEGDKVTRGQVLGLVGGTGRASGPHLHLAVRWQGTYLDPAVLLKLKLH